MILAAILAFLSGSLLTISFFGQSTSRSDEALIPFISALALAICAGALIYNA